MQYFKDYLDLEIEFELTNVNESNMRSFLDFIVNKVKASTSLEMTKNIVNKVLRKTFDLKKELIPTLVAALLICTPLSSLVSSSTLTEMEKFQIQKLIEKKEKELYFTKISNIDESEFLAIIAKKESTNNWTVCNKYGYVGKYQMGELALLDTYDNVNVKYYKTLKGNRREKVKKLMADFREISNSKELTQTQKEEKLKNIFSEDEQDQVMRAYIKVNEKYLKNFKKYIGKEINGILITWSGMIAAAHLRGAVSVKKYLKSEGTEIPKDLFGTSVEDYMKLFI